MTSTNPAANPGTPQQTAGANSSAPPGLATAATPTTPPGAGQPTTPTILLQTAARERLTKKIFETIDMASDLEEEANNKMKQAMEASPMLLAQKQC